MKQTVRLLALLMMAVIYGSSAMAVVDPYEVMQVTPAEGEVESLQHFTITFAELPVVVSEDAVPLLEKGGGATYEGRMQTDEAGTTVLIDFDVNCTASGHYFLHLPGGSLTVDGKPLLPLSLRFNISGTMESFYDQITIDPAEGELESLQNFTISFPEYVGEIAFGSRPTLTNNTTGDVYQGQMFDVGYKVLANFPREVTDSGDYTLSIPAGSIVFYTLDSEVRELTFNYSLTGTAPSFYDKITIDPAEGRVESLQHFTITFPMEVDALAPDVMAMLTNTTTGATYEAAMSSLGDKVYVDLAEAYRAGAHWRPVVVWNCTPACNLSCSHCYAATAGEQKVMDTGQALAVIDDLADFGVPVLLFSGGEPFARPDIRSLAAHAKARGLRVTFSTNGTLIDDACADWIRDLGVAYVGISIDGTEAIHDAFRRQPGAYRLALDAIRRLRDRDVKVGLRVTMTRDNVRAIPAIFDLMRAERVPRICLYHLVYTGRGKEIAATDLSHDEARAALETIIAETKACFDAGFPVEVLTVDNPCDGIALYLKMAAEGHPNAEKALELLTLNGGNSSGEGIGCISWDGTVYPDQFWRNRPVGNVLEKPFSEIWGKPPPGSLLDLLRHKKEHVKGRCRTCRWLNLCGGNFRARGEAVTGDIWGEDPTCYLTDEEVKSL